MRIERGVLVPKRRCAFLATTQIWVTLSAVRWILHRKSRCTCSSEPMGRVIPIALSETLV